MSEELNTYGANILPIAELNNGIILASYKRADRAIEGSGEYNTYQSEAMLEKGFIGKLLEQGYTYLEANTQEELYANLKLKLERLNKVTFSDSEWHRFLLEYLDSPNDDMIAKTRKIQIDYVHSFRFDNGELLNIRLIDKKDIHSNSVEVASQVRQEAGQHHNRYDVTILVNGLPLVHVELKRRGVSLREAFNQVHRYSRESFNAKSSLYRYVQLFVISNGTYTRYFANTTARGKNNYEFTSEWADAKNQVISDLEDFTRTFFAKRTLLELITKYCVFDVTDTLLVMRPYQIAATERILQKIRSSFDNKCWGKSEAGGFIWHTTGSGKTLTSFKTARLATELDFIDKVFFVVDRKDLDYQTMKEYQRFQKDSVNGSKDTKELKLSIEKDDSRIVVTTIQKLNEFVKSYPKHSIYQKHCVLIYDECHRSQFGEAQRNIRKVFKRYYQFGFTGTPIFTENALGADTTAGTFGSQLHSYVITDAIRDGKVLKFKVDYNSISPKFREAEKEQDNDTLNSLEKSFLNHPERIRSIARHILKVYDAKTHRNENYQLKDRRLHGFNAMLAVESVEAARLYYEAFISEQEHIPADKRLSVATIYSYQANEAEVGEIVEESFTPTALSGTAKEFLDRVIADYNARYKVNYSTAGNDFQSYYKDLSQRVKNKEVDILIVVGMFLTGFDAPTLNTLFVDKNLRYHGLIQAYSRTNRILNEVKTFGNIVCFRDLERATEEAIRLFGNKDSLKVILERSYKEYMEGYKDEETGRSVKGYKEISRELLERFPEPTSIELEADKKDFVRLFGELLKADNILRNYDEFQEFEKPISLRLMQDMKSVYVDIRDSLPKSEKCNGESSDKKAIDWDGVEFYLELLKTAEINLDYILNLIFEHSKKSDSIEELKANVRRHIRSSLGTRAKEELIMDFISDTDVKSLKDSTTTLETFYAYAKEVKEKRIEEMLAADKLNNKDGNARRLIDRAINIGEFVAVGTELDSIMPPVSRRQGQRARLKQYIREKIASMVEVFTGI